MRYQILSLRNSHDVQLQGICVLVTITRVLYTILQWFLASFTTSIPPSFFDIIGFRSESRSNCFMFLFDARSSMKLHFVAYLFSLHLAYVEASPFLSASASTSIRLDTDSVSTESQVASPTCYQPRASSDPPASQISMALTNANAVANACSNTTTLHSRNHTIKYDAGAYSFKFSESKNVDPNSSVLKAQARYCSQIFQNIISICVVQRSFWGGWAQIGNSNWSISNKVYPQDLLPLPKLVDTSSPTGQPSETQYLYTVSTKGSPKPISTIASNDPSRLILAIEDVASNEKISLGTVAAAVSKTSGPTRSISSRQSPTQTGTPIDPSIPPTTSIGTFATALQGISSRSLASLASKTERIDSSPTIKQASQGFQQEALVTSVSPSTTSTGIFESQSPKTVSFPGSSVGGNGSAKITPSLRLLNIAPDYTITDAFRLNLNTSTISASNGAVLRYSMLTFSNLANRTGTPILVQTTVSEILASGSPVAFIGGVWVASGGRFWFPPGVPEPESGEGLKPGLQIRPPCISPFCSGKITSNGGGDPEGEPPLPYQPPNPPSQNAPPADEWGEEPDQETQDSYARSKEDLSQARSKNARTIIERTIPTSLLTFSTVSRPTMSSSSTASSAETITERTVLTSLSQSLSRRLQSNLL